MDGGGGSKPQPNAHVGEEGVLVKAQQQQIFPAIKTPAQQLDEHTQD